VGTILSPAFGTESKVPSGVQYTVDGAVGATTVGHVRDRDQPGTSLKIESLFQIVRGGDIKGAPEAGTEERAQAEVVRKTDPNRPGRTDLRKSKKNDRSRH